MSDPTTINIQNNANPIIQEAVRLSVDPQASVISPKSSNDPKPVVTPGHSCNDPSTDSCDSGAEAHDRFVVVNSQTVTSGHQDTFGLGYLYRSVPGDVGRYNDYSKTPFLYVVKNNPVNESSTQVASTDAEKGVQTFVSPLPPVEGHQVIMTLLNGHILTPADLKTIHETEPKNLPAELSTGALEVLESKIFDNGLNNGLSISQPVQQQKSPNVFEINYTLTVAGGGLFDPKTQTTTETALWDVESGKLSKIAVKPESKPVVFTYDRNP